MDTSNTERTFRGVLGVVLMVFGTLSIVFSAYLYLVGINNRHSVNKPTTQAPAAGSPVLINQITDIIYTQDIAVSDNRGEYHVILKMTNQGSAKTNQLPNALLDFLTVEGEPGQRVGRRIIPTAIYRAAEYAPYELDRGFSQYQLTLDIKVPEGTQVIASCLTYAGPDDMANPRCTSKITTELNRPTQGATQ